MFPKSHEIGGLQMRDNNTKPLVFRGHWGHTALVAFAAVAFPVDAWYLLRNGSINLWALVALCIALMAPVALIAALQAKVVLADEEIVIVNNFRSKRHPRSAFSSASWSRGCPVFLALKAGEKIDLPSQYAATQQLISILNAWIKKGLPAAEARKQEFKKASRR